MKKKMLSFLAVLCCLVLCAACGSDLSGHAKNDVYNGGAQNEAAPAADSVNGKSPVKTDTAGKDMPVSDSQKLIKTMSFTIETLDFEKSLQELGALVGRCGGYVEDAAVSGQSSGSRSSRTARYIIRIPAERLNEAESAIGSLGNVLSANSNVKDISLSYADTASRVKALEIQRDNLMEMMKKAESLSDMLQIQDHLTNVEYQLESHAAQLRVMDNQVNYSTVSILLEEVKIFTEEHPGFGQRIAQTFRSSLKGVGEFFEDFVVVIVGNLPAILVFCLVVFLVVFVSLRISKARKKKKARTAVRPVSEPPVLKD